MATPIMLYHEVINACAKSVGCERIYDTLKRRMFRTSIVFAFSPEYLRGSFAACYVALNVGYLRETKSCVGKKWIIAMAQLEKRNFSSSPSSSTSSSSSSSQFVLPAEKRSSAWLVANEPSMPAKMTNATAELN